MKEDISSDSELYLPQKKENDKTRISGNSQESYVSRIYIILFYKIENKKYKKKGIPEKRFIKKNKDSNKKNYQHKLQQQKILEMDTFQFLSKHSISSLFENMANLRIKQVLK